MQIKEYFYYLAIRFDIFSSYIGKNNIWALLILTLHSIFKIGFIINPKYIQDSFTDNQNITIIMFILQPYKYLANSTCLSKIIVLSIILFVQLLMIFIFFGYQKLFKMKRIILFFSYFLQTYQYFFVFQIFGAIFQTFGNIQTDQNFYKYLIYICAFITLFLNIIFCIILWTFNFNFLTTSKDNLTRHPTFIFLFFALGLSIIIGIDIYNIPEIMLDFICFLYSILFLGFTLIMLPYYHYNTLLGQIFVEFNCLWIFGVNIFSKLSKIQMINDNLVLLVLVGFIFSAWCLNRHFYFLKDYLLNKDFHEFSNSYLINQKLIQLTHIITKKNLSKQEELSLAAMIEFHSTNCDDLECICKNRESLYDYNTNKASNLNVPAFKDPILLKYLILKMLINNNEKLKRFPIYQLSLIQYYMQVIQNLPKTQEKIIEFKKTFKKSYLMDEICYLRIYQKIEIMIDERNKNIKGDMKFENIKKYDIIYDQITKNIIQIIHEYAQFWSSLCEKTNNQQTIKQKCLIIIKLKKIIKELFKEILEIQEDNITIYKIIIFFYQHIVKDPELTIKYQSRMIIFQEKFSFKQKNKIDLVDKNSFIVEISLSENLGKFLWSSKNTQNVIGYNQKILNSLYINQIQPKVIAKRYHQLMNKFLENGSSQNINKQSIYYAINQKKKLFQMIYLRKFYIENNLLRLISYIKKLNSLNYMIINEKGEIDYFGKQFHLITQLEYDFPNNYDNVPIFLFCPVLINHFLPNFYEIQDFQLENFDIPNSNLFYWFTYKDQPKLIEKLQFYLGKSKNMQQYLKNLFSLLSEIQFEQVENMYVVEMKIKNEKVLIQNINFEYNVVEIIDFQKIDLLQSVFEQQQYIIEKLNLNKNNQQSLSTYHKRISQKQQDNSRINQSQEQSYLIRTGQLTKTQNSIYNFDQVERQQAMNIIKKLFYKEFNPVGDLESCSISKKRWLDLINKSQQQKNKKVNFVETHIEKMSKNFIPQIFFPELNCLKRNTNNNIFNVCQDQTLNFKTTYQTQKNEIQFIDKIKTVKKIIIKDIKQKKKKLLFVFLFYTIVLLLNFTSSLLQYNYFFVNNNQLIENEVSQELITHQEFFDFFSQITSFYQLFYFELEIGSTQFNDKQYRTSESIQDPLYNKIIEDYIEFQQRIKYEWIFKEFYVPREIQFSSSQKFQQSYVDFLLKTRFIWNQSYHEQQLYEGIIEQNFQRILKHCLSQEKQFMQKLKDIKDNFFKTANYIQIIFTVLNIFFLTIIFLISIQLLSKSDDIILLFSKIDLQFSKKMKKFFKQLSFNVKLKQESSLEQIFTEFKFKEKKKTKKVNLRTFKKNKKPLIIWIFSYILISSFIFIQIIFQRIHLIKNIDKIYKHYVFFGNFSFYDMQVTGSYWLMIKFISKQGQQQLIQINESNHLQESIDLWKQIKQSLQQKTLFLSLEQNFDFDEKFQQFYSKTYRNKQNCEYLEQFNLCKDFNQNNIFGLSPRINQIQFYSIMQKIDNLLDQQYFQKNDFDPNTLLFKEFKQNFFRVIAQNQLNLQYSKELSNQIIRFIDKIKFYNRLDVFLDLFNLLTIFILFYFLLYKKLKNQTIQNDQIIEVIPLDMIVKNQYFKMFLNSKNNQLIQNIKFLFFLLQEYNGTKIIIFSKNKNFMLQKYFSNIKKQFLINKFRNQFKRFRFYYNDQQY